MIKHFTLVILLTFILSGNSAFANLKRAHEFLNRGAFALAEHELNQSINESPLFRLQLYCEVYYLTGKHQQLLQTSNEYWRVASKSKDSIAHKVFYYTQLTKYYTALLHVDSLVYYSREMLRLYRTYKPNNSFIDVSMVYAQYMNSGRNSVMDDKYSYCDSVFYYYFKQYGKAKSYKLSKLHYIVGLMYLQRFEQAKYPGNHVPKRVQQQYFTMAATQFKTAMKMSKELGLYHTTLYAQPCSVLSLLYYYNDYPISKCLVLINDAIGSINPLRKSSLYYGYMFQAYEGALNWKVNYHYKLYKQTSNINELNRAIITANELLVLQRNYVSNQTIYDSYYDVYNTNSYSKLSGLYYELYKKTGNISYRNRAFGYAEYLKRITTQPDSNDKLNIGKREYMKFDSLLLKINLKGNYYSKAVFVRLLDTIELDSYILDVQKRLKHDEVLYYLNPVNMALDVSDITIKWVITSKYIRDTIVSLQVSEDITDILFESAKHNDVKQYKQNAYYTYQHIFGDMVHYFPTHISRLFVSPTFRHKVINYEGLLVDFSGNSFKNLNYLFHHYAILQVRNTTYIGSDYVCKVSAKNPISIMAPKYNDSQYSELPNTQQMLNSLLTYNYFNAITKKINSKSEVFHYSGHIVAAKGLSNLSLFCTDEEHYSVSDLLPKNSIKLAFIQGCQSSSGRHMMNMSQEGISKQLLGANVKSIISTLWPIDDKSSSILMSEVYKNLHKQDVAVSLNTAKKELFGRGYDNPIYWLGIYYEGAPATIQFDKEVEYGNWVVAVGLLLVLLLIIFRYIG